jgi:hypothetical protein
MDDKAEKMKSKILLYVRLCELVPQELLEIRANAVLEKHEVENTNRTLYCWADRIRHSDNCSEHQITKMNKFI